MSDWFSKLSARLIRSLPRGTDRLKDRPHAGPNTEEKSPARGKSANNAEETGQIDPDSIPMKGSRPTVRTKAGRSSAYALVIGLDFGTAYTKAVIRDSYVPGRAYPVAFRLRSGWSYLVPSDVFRNGEELKSSFDLDGDNKLPRIDYLKMRLVAEADSGRACAWRPVGLEQGEARVAVAWFLAQVLAHIGSEILQIWPDFGGHADDSCFVNVCVPIAYAKNRKVESSILDALCAARNSVGPVGTVPPSVAKIRHALADEKELIAARSFCYTYPETSANLQAYLRSRARRPGLYLFIDVGAGTMDLSFFILNSDPNQEKPLVYLHGSVLDVGSARLEIEVLKRNPSLQIEEVVLHKEGRARHQNRVIEDALARVRRQLREEVASGVGRGVEAAEGRLSEDRKVAQRQMKQVTMLFAGGGFCADPYEHGARFFHQARKWGHRPPARELPTADDLKWSDGHGAKPIGFKRLSVAYGLSFPRFELEDQKYPDEIVPAPRLPDDGETERPTAPSKDDV